MKTKNFFKFLTLLVMIVFTLTPLGSCSKDDDDDKPKDVSIVGRWEYTEVDEDDDEIETVTMILKFNNDHTGYIEEHWQYETKATSHESYRMDFSWNTTSDSNGNEILKVSYVSGDKITELFPGSTNTVLWTRQYVLTGNVLNIYDTDGVWVFKRK